MFATLHAGLGVKQTHSYARSLKRFIAQSDENEACFGILQDMFFAFLIFCTLAADQPSPLSGQICLDKDGFSCNAIDGIWGAKSERARELRQSTRQSFGPYGNLFRIEAVTQADLDALVAIPKEPADKAKLPHMGYESIKETFADRGHLSPRGLERLNPGIDWSHVAVGTKLVIPDFPSIEENLAAGDPLKQKKSKRPLAEVVKVSLSKFEITVWGTNSTCLALFPCSIAKDKAKRPQAGELRVVTKIPHPNYTYTPDFVPKGQKASKHILMDGPNNPVGVAWIGLSLPTYGIHGTPKPETIGSAESHGCFRLSNWNVARLYALVKIGTKVVIEP